MSSKRIDHYYAFTIKDGERIPSYERTFGTLSAVMAWVKERSTPQKMAFFTINCLPKDYWY